MSQNGRTNTKAAYEKRQNAGRAAGSRNAYVQGNTARRLETASPQEEPRQQPRQVRKNRDKARHMSAGYVLFLAVALCTGAFILVNYIQLQAELTNRIKSVAAKESQLNSLRISNDEEYNRIISSINLEDIKRIAIGELGMIYAEEGQIITYTNENNDYMRQVTDSH